jgi:hypothetical protein
MLKHLEAWRPGDLGVRGRGSEKNVQENTFLLTWGFWGAFWVVMNATKTRQARWCWRKDLAGFRGLSDRERAGFLVVLEWFGVEVGVAGRAL